MPPRPRSRLDLFLVCTDSRETAHADVEGVWSWMRSRGSVDEQGRAVVDPASVVEGGFAAARVEHSNHPRWFHAGSGGTRVTCPRCDRSVVRDFNGAMGRLKLGEVSHVECAGCNLALSLGELKFHPPASIGFSAVAFMDVGGVRLGPDLQAHLDSREIAFEIVLHRPSY